LAAVEPRHDFEWVATQIDFDFEADPSVLARTDPDHFDAIEPKNVSYEYDLEIQSIIAPFRNITLSSNIVG